ncbi:MAG: hypothetical protein GQ532_08965 [Methylomarinum sp.]|nr:hypothetical protein [Methylomarinum sp.]
MTLTLQQIVTTDPDARGYASMTDADIETDIKEKRHSSRKLVSFVDFQQFLFDYGVILNVMTAKNDVNHAAHTTAVIVDQMMKFGAERLSAGVDLDNAGNDGLFDAMVASDLMSAAVRETMELLGDSPASLADINQLSGFNHLDIAKITGGAN